MKNRYTVHREKASQDQLENMHNLIKESLVKNREEDKKYNIQRKYILVTGDSWAQGELDESKESDWSATHSVSGYLASLFPQRYVAVGFPNPGWDDFESIYVIQQMQHMFDYVVFFKTCGLRSIMLQDHPGREDFGITEEEFDVKNVIAQGRIINDIVYEMLKEWESKLILIGGLNKITNDGAKLNTVLTIPSVLEKYDSNARDVDVFGWEDMWEFYKPRVKGNRAYQDSLLEVMDNFGKKKQYMEAPPHHYFPDGKHPNKVLHKDLANYIGEHLWTL